MKDESLVLFNDDGKVCGRCGSYLPYTSFHRKRDTDDTLQVWCKDCQNEYARYRRKKITASRSEFADHRLRDIPDLLATARPSSVRAYAKTLRSLASIAENRLRFDAKKIRKSTK